MFEKLIKKVADGDRQFYYSMSFFDAPNKSGETEVIAVEVVAGSRDEAEEVARKAMGKDKKLFCRVTQIVEVSIRPLLDLKDELSRAATL